MASQQHGFIHQQYHQQASGIQLPPPPPPPPSQAPRTPSPHTPGTQSLNHAVPYQSLHRAAVDPSRRLRPAHVLPNITTSVDSLPNEPGSAYGVDAAQTPLNIFSAPPLSVPFSPFSNHSSGSVTATTPQAPVSILSMRGAAAATVVAPYNPQEWSSRSSSGMSGPATAGAYGQHVSASPAQRQVRAADLTGMESANLPSPPPPYSPTSAQPHATSSSPLAASQSFSQAHATQYQQSLTGVTLGSVHQLVASPGGMSPFEQQRVNTLSHDIPRSGTPPSFPPPPPRNARDRSGSRSRTDPRSLLSALTSRSRTFDPSHGTSAIDSLRLNTNEALTRTHTHTSARQQHNSSALASNREASATGIEYDATAPAARRAISAGAINAGIHREHSPQVFTSGRQTMAALPGPPPGPPPASNRSQSMSEASDRSYSPARHSGTNTPVAAPATRRPPQRGTQLGPVPPTPVDWVPQTPRTNALSHGALHVDTSVANTSSSSRLRHVDIAGEQDSLPTSAIEASTANQSIAGTPGSAGLVRRAANRESSARGIRERRSESRAARERTDLDTRSDALSSAKPMDLSLPAKHQVKNPPNSAGLVAEGTARPFSASTQHRTTHSISHLSQTPPFTPAPDSAISRKGRGKSPALHTVTLPTPPQRSAEEYFQANQDSTLSASLGSQASHEYSPKDDFFTPSGSRIATPRTAGMSHFTLEAIERHRAFVLREAAARTDVERLEMFAAYIVSESRLRRDRYSAAFDSMAAEVLDLTRDLWRSHYGGRRAATPLATPASAVDGGALVKTATSSSNDSHLVGSSTEELGASHTPRTSMDSPASVTSQGRAGDDGLRGGTFKPCLSPIPSMAMSTIPDEQDSRGRPPTRWWESSVDNESAGRTGGRRIERSKRESKYMGVPVDQLVLLETAAAAAPATPQTGGAGPSAPMHLMYGSNEYPPEKVEHESQQQLTPMHNPYWNHSSPNTPNPYKLDVSRLVTLPPPFPRHHPALSNSHPDPAGIDFGKIDQRTICRANASKLTEMRNQQEADKVARRESLRRDIQSQIQSGAMSYADAAAAETQFTTTQEPRKIRDALQAQFDAYQEEVMTPLHALLSERITKCSAALEHFKASLKAEQDSAANGAQEEGDDKPELLEKLTLLKWLFEARETLHRELFAADSQRCEMYKVLVVLPYRAAGNEDKAVDAEQFFAADDLERRSGFESEAQKRAEDFLTVVEDNVTRGVEDLLGAFWDIAPGLAGVIQKIPDDLSVYGGGGGEGIQEILIPEAEYVENPSYHEHPLQYLYSLLLHAEKSAYQFIESQTNLLCLLHEAKTTVMSAGSKVIEGVRFAAGEDEDVVKNEMDEVRRREERKLTSDLKDKVGVVDGQWREGLGDSIVECRRRVEDFLVTTGGWDESLQD